MDIRPHGIYNNSSNLGLCRWSMAGAFAGRPDGFFYTRKGPSALRFKTAVYFGFGLEIKMSHLHVVTSSRLAEALQDRDKFLKKHPELAVLQKEIDTKLKNAASDHNRMIVIQDLMMASVQELSRKLRSLVKHSEPA